LSDSLVIFFQGKLGKTYGNIPSSPTETNKDLKHHKCMYAFKKANYEIILKLCRWLKEDFVSFPII